jgi:hypothetical protein
MKRFVSLSLVLVFGSFATPGFVAAGSQSRGAAEGSVQTLECPSNCVDSNSNPHLLYAFNPSAEDDIFVSLPDSSNLTISRGRYSLIFVTSNTHYLIADNVLP